MLHRAQLADFRGKKLGFIFQNFNLLDTLTAYENISLALSIAGAKPSEIEQRIPQIAQALNIQDVLGKYPYQMSGGQQQRWAGVQRTASWDGYAQRIFYKNSGSSFRLGR